VDLRICKYAGWKAYYRKKRQGNSCRPFQQQKTFCGYPHKIRDILGIIADVNLKQEDGKEYLEIAVEPYPSPVNYRGEYHYRTGSTKQELKGHALDSFLLKKYGLHWDGVPDPHLKITNLEDQIFSMFVRKGLKSGRLDSSAGEDTKEQLLDNLKLVEGSYFKRAAALLFSDDPEIVAVGAYVKIGFFRTNINLLYQDEIHGNIFSQVDRTLDLLTTKYLKAYIHYEGVQRADAKEPEIKYDFGGVMVTFTGEVPDTSEGGEKSREKNYSESSQETTKKMSEKRSIKPREKTLVETPGKHRGNAGENS
jgi:hypothetical protein